MLPIAQAKTRVLVPKRGQYLVLVPSTSVNDRAECRMWYRSWVERALLSYSALSAAALELVRGIAGNPAWLRH